MSDSANVDCETGRTLGCQTFCCRLLVRRDSDGCEAGTGSETPRKRFIEKTADGYCVHLDRKSHLCSIWDQRSSTCRGYTCNRDFLLQVAVRHEFKNIVELVRISTTAYIPKETYVQIPHTPEQDHASLIL